MDTPILVVTPGEPAGIGPDITLAAAKQSQAPFLVAASPALMHDRAAQLGIDIEVNDWTATGSMRAGALNLVPVELRAPVKPGRLDPRNAPYVLDTLEHAVQLCESGTCAALVTAPVNKAVINDAGIPFTGHTEWLESRTSARHVVMMLVTTGLKVALVTTHLPLREVADAITPDLLQTTIRIVHDDLGRHFGIVDPSILVLGLNPHAGESGHMGREEIDIIEPVIRAMSDTCRLTGPMPADTAFTPGVLARHDVVLAMYHDQGLPVLKYKGFGNAANITLGLDIIRTSVDHGTALDIAGTGRADPASLVTALTWAATMADNARRNAGIHASP